MTYWSVVFALPAAVRDQLTTYFATLAGEVDVEVMTGPRSTAAGKDVLMVQSPRAVPRNVRTGGIRDEDGTFELRVYCEHIGVGEDAIDAARERADLILHRAAEAIAADITVGGLCAWAEGGEVAEDDQGAGDSNVHSYTAHLTVSFKALTTGS